MAPEIFESKPKYGHKADIWGVGTIVYEMLTGYAAFQCTGLRELIQLHERGFKIPTGVQLSAPAADLVSRMLDRNPATRIDIAGIRAHPFVTGVEAPAEPEPPTAPDQGSLDIIGEELNESDNHVSTE
jgi:serine/threonine protein kinase